MAGQIIKGARRFTTQIGAAGVADAVVTTIPLVSVTGLPTDTPIEIIVDRSDSSGTLTPSKEEVIQGTVSGLNLINCIRGVEGSAQAHSAGATVNAILTASMWNNLAQWVLDTPSRGLIGGVINVSAPSNNLTVAVKTLQGTDPSPTNPVGIWIGNQLRSITGALTVTANAGSSVFNAGSAELATREIDYFVYMGYGTVSNRVFIGLSRLPYARLQSDLNVLSITNEKFFQRNETANDTDSIVNVGRFAATNSGAASFNWSVPSFTNANLIQEPVYETRWLNWTPDYTQTGGMTFTSVTTTEAQYKVFDRYVKINFRFSGTTGGSADTQIEFTAPFTPTTTTINLAGSGFDGGLIGVLFRIESGRQLGAGKYTGTPANWSLGSGKFVNGTGDYLI